MINNKSLALFDFDGTITKKDTFIEFIKFTHGSVKFWAGILVLSPMLSLYALKFIKNEKAKTIMFNYFFKGWEHKRLMQAGEEFCKIKLPFMLRKEALSKIKEHQSNGDRIVLITASIKEWVMPWCKTMEIEIISTEIEVINNTITGQLSSANCYGPEKVNRLKKLLSMDDYSTIYAYGDSKGDREMLALSQHPHFKPFNL
jgi:phosphatidylglycerophosphatase C